MKKCSLGLRAVSVTCCCCAQDSAKGFGGGLCYLTVLIYLPDLHCGGRYPAPVTARAAKPAASGLLGQSGALSGSGTA